MILSRRSPRAVISIRTLQTVASHDASPSARAKAKLAFLEATRPFSPELVDSFDRHHDYLRISLTERCNLRCFYCMPEEGVELSPSSQLLTNEEIIRLATLFVKSGVTKIRLTGGEPTIRKGILEIIAQLNTLREYGLKSIAMTSNGLALHRRLPELVENGLTHLNLSLDTLDPFKFEMITRRRGHDAVLKALDVALASNLKSVKLNVVVVKGLNEAEVPDFVGLTKDNDLSVRFIEFMPFTGNKWDKAKMIPSSQLLDQISGRLTPIRTPDEPNDTARSWRIPGYRGTFGFISSMSDHFCSSCNRLRITADGKIKVCLFDAKEVSLRDELRAGASNTELLRIIGSAISGKQAKHAGMEDIDVVTNRPMILIGGTLHRAPRYIKNTAKSSGLHPVNFVQRSSRRLSTSVTRFDAAQPRLTHLDANGRASMVDVSNKSVSRRTATAQGRIYIPPIAFAMLERQYPIRELSEDPTLRAAIDKARRKGDTLTTAQLAGIMGAKRTADLIPLCHPLALSNVSVRLTVEPPGDGSNGQIGSRHSILCCATVTCEGKTGVEMEALTAVSVSLLTVWDMLKAVAGKEMEIGKIMVVRKEGGRSGDFVRSRNGE
ncbi:molybdenum cofactor biosynthesis prote [Pluteus cervinus]|uniref:Molybdenum cofactor biosynthesis prote n=1 Tax=Pluteus cervinus TaxID=181527 RepID=A0ACD3BIC5_9AGAR|nr:molybdenum cofactor biosynthesis prote [Pluteus cervinus]